MTEPFTMLCQRFQVAPNRQGECWIPCPYCGKDEHARRCTHASFSERGFHCFACGANAGLRQFAGHLQVVSDYQATAPIYQPRPQRTAPWKLASERYLGEITLASPLERLSQWRRYKPVDLESLLRWELGIGILPPVYYRSDGTSVHARQCGHVRLVHPVRSNGRIVMFRGRAIDCDCPKWLFAPGSETSLFGADAITSGRPLIIVENPIDAILAMQIEPRLSAVASTTGAGTWREEWTQRIVASQPSSVLVWLDNDLVGCPNRETYARLAEDWRQDHLGRGQPPEPNGPRIVAALLSAGCQNVSVYHWPDGTPAKTDVGEYLKRVMV